MRMYLKHTHDGAGHGVNHGLAVPLPEGRLELLCAFFLLGGVELGPILRAPMHTQLHERTHTQMQI